MKAGKVYEEGRENGNYLISKGYAVLVSDDEVEEEAPVIIRGTVQMNQQTIEEQPTAEQIKDQLIAAKTVEFKNATDKNDKRRLRDELNALRRS